MTSEAPVVCVPARDEAERLPRLLASLDGQTGLGDRLKVVVVVNNSRDGTADIVRAAQIGGGLPRLCLRLVETWLDPDQAHVGTARRMALDAGVEWVAPSSHDDGVLLTTDADARVPPDWVAANLRALTRADIVGGRLVIDRDEPGDPTVSELDGRIERYWVGVRAMEDEIDPPSHDPAPRHGDHTGASLALRVSHYRQVGGLPRLPRGEDNALVAAVREAGGRLRHCPEVRVHVSDRRVGRADGGMAIEMARRAEVRAGGDRYLLPAPGHWHAILTRRAALRRAWRAGCPDTACGLTADDLAVIRPADCPNDIAFVERAARRLEVRDAPAPLVPLDDALAGFGLGHGLAA